MKRLLLAACLALAGCGDDSAGSGTPDSGGGADARIERDMGPVNDANNGGGGDTTTSPDAATDVRTDTGGGGGDECESDFDCADGVFCNGVERCFRGLCFPSPTIQCADESACTLDQCDELNQRCDFVPDDSMCAPGQVCKSKGGCFTPAGCALDADCDDTLLCNGAERCLGGQCEPGEPVACGDGLNCTNDTCVEGTGQCQSVADHNRCLATELCVLAIGCSPRPPCMTNDDCDDGLFCNGTETCGADAVCIPGTPPMAPDNVACTIDQCNETLNLVVNTPDHARCSDGLFCNGAERCHPVNGCGPGAPPVLADGVSCTVDTCNESLKLVEHAPNDAACDDNLFCNGLEVCHPIDDCSPGEPPILNDGVGCTVDTCSEVMDMVVHVGNDSLCNDGLFCNGEEECDPINDCQTVSVPIVDDGIPCTADACDENADTVVHVPNHSLCGGGDVCTGAEQCDANLGCVMGQPADTDDGIACTIDACDASGGVTHTPDDSLCDDGLFCNGVETCSATTGCTAGTPPGNDNNPCTNDVCNEMNDTTANLPASNGAVCSSSPRSICLSGNCSTSICGDFFTDTGRGEQCDDGNASNTPCDANCQNVVSSCDPDGPYIISQISGTCAGGLANWEASTLTFSGDGAFVTGLFTGFIAPSSPRTMTGAATSCPSGSFSVSFTEPGGPGGCDETFVLAGSFTGVDTWSGTFTASFSGSACGQCQSGGPFVTNVNAIRQ